MTLDPLLLQRLFVAAAVALLMIGAVGAWTAANGVKRIVGIVIALTGAVLGCAGLMAPQGAAVAGVAVGFAYVIVAVAVLVRLQEAYGGVETPEIDREEAEAERVQR